MDAAPRDPSQTAFWLGLSLPRNRTEHSLAGAGCGGAPIAGLGGLSTVWAGHAAVPGGGHRQLAGQTADLEPHYRAVTGFTGWSRSATISRTASAALRRPQRLQASRQADLLLGNLHRHRAALRERGWRFGRAGWRCAPWNRPRAPVASIALVHVWLSLRLHLQQRRHVQAMLADNALPTNATSSSPPCAKRPARSSSKFHRQTRRRSYLKPAASSWPRVLFRHADSAAFPVRLRPPVALA